MSLAERALKLHIYTYIPAQTSLTLAKHNMRLTRLSISGITKTERMLSVSLSTIRVCARFLEINLQWIKDPSLKAIDEVF